MDSHDWVFDVVKTADIDEDEDIEMEEDSSKPLYHGSNKNLPVGTILKPQDWHQSWGQNAWAKILEKYRPTSMMPHSRAVFMTDNIDDIFIAGGGTKWVFTVEALGPVQKHDLNWGSDISLVLQNWGGDAAEEAAEQGNIPPEIEAEIRDLAENYWNGVESGEPLWEYLSPSAKIIAVEKY